MNQVFGKKIGMTSLFNDKGEKVGVTVLQVYPTKVLQIKTKEKDGYEALVLGFGTKKEKRVRKPQSGLFKKVNTAPVKHIREVTAEDYTQYEVGQDVGLEQFGEVSSVHVAGVSKGKGFAGTIKRYHFGRGRETHGNKNHRAPGSIGQCAQPGKVWKGQKLPGQMGAKRTTVRNLDVVRIISEKNLIVVKGSVPGSKNSLVPITKVNAEKQVTHG